MVTQSKPLHYDPHRLAVCSHWKLTGIVKARRGWFGRMVHQVEEYRETGWASFDGPKYNGKEYRMRDATLDDLLDLGMYKVEVDLAEINRGRDPTPSEAGNRRRVSREVSD